MDVGADSNIGRVSPSHGKRGGNNSVVCGQGSGNMVVCGQGSGNMVVCGKGSGNMVVCGQGSGNMVVCGGQGRSNSIGGSKRRNNIGAVDQGWVSLSLTLDNMLNRTVLGNIRWAIHTVGHSSVVLWVVVAGNSVAGNNRRGNSSDNMRNNALDKRSSNSPYNWGGNSLDNWGSNSPDKRGGNMAVRVGSGSIGASVRGISVIKEGRVSLSFSLALGNEVAEERGGRVGREVGESSVVCGQGNLVVSGGHGSSNMVVSGGQGKSTIGRDILSISSGFRLGHSSGGKSENYEHIHGAGGASGLSKEDCPH